MFRNGAIKEPTQDELRKRVIPPFRFPLKTCACCDYLSVEENSRDRIFQLVHMSILDRVNGRRILWGDVPGLLCEEERNHLPLREPNAGTKIDIRLPHSRVKIERENEGWCSENETWSGERTFVEEFDNRSDCLDALSPKAWEEVKKRMEQDSMRKIGADLTQAVFEIAQAVGEMQEHLKEMRDQLKEMRDWFGALPGQPDYLDAEVRFEETQAERCGSDMCPSQAE